MSHWSREAAVSRYGFILDRLGLSGDEVAGLSAVTPASGEPDVFGYDTVDERVPETVLHDRLLETLVESSLGFEAPRRYWNELPSIQLQEVLERHDTDLLVDPNHDGESAIAPPDGRATTLGARDRVTGANAYTQFEYPDTALADDNYPALVDAVQSNLLDDTALQFVRLVDDGDCWRFLLVERDRLAALQTEFGERIELRGRPLLAAHQPSAFNRDVASDSADGSELPPALTEDTDPSAVRELFEEAVSTSFETLSLDDGELTDASFDHGERGEPDVDELVDADDPVAAVDASDAAGAPSQDDATAAPTDATGAGARVEDLDELFADLDEHTLDSEEAAPDAGNASGESDLEETVTDDLDGAAADIAALAATATVDWSVGGTLNAGVLDAVFEEMERSAAMSTFRVATTADDDQVTSRDLLSAVDDEDDADADATDGIDEEFVWLDDDELTAAPDTIAHAADIELSSSARSP